MLVLTSVAQLVGDYPVRQGKKLLVQFLVRAHAWLASFVPSQGVYGRQTMDGSLLHQCFPPSLSFSLPLSLK